MNKKKFLRDLILISIGLFILFPISGILDGENINDYFEVIKNPIALVLIIMICIIFGSFISYMKNRLKRKYIFLRNYFSIVLISAFTSISTFPFVYILIISPNVKYLIATILLYIIIWVIIYIMFYRKAVVIYDDKTIIVYNCNKKVFRDALVNKILFERDNSRKYLVFIINYEQFKVRLYLKEKRINSTISKIKDELKLSKKLDLDT